MAGDDRELVLGETGLLRGSRHQRVGAALYDLFVVAWAIGILLGAVTVAGLLPEALGAGTGLLGLWAVLVFVEGATGRSPGKHVVGLDVVVVRDGEVLEGTPGLLTAGSRRPWSLPLLAAPFGGVLTQLGTAGALLVLLSMAVSTLRAPDGRGWHDRFAGTAVVDGPFSRRARLVVVLVTVVAAMLGIVLASIAVDPTVA